MAISKIVVGTDFSSASDMAVNQAMHVARHTGAGIILVHAGDSENAVEVAETVSGTVEELEKIVQEGAKHHQHELEALRTRLSGQGVDISQALVGGYPDEAICEAAKVNEADLIVTGTHGRTGLKRFLLGSVAERVVRVADRSVLVAKSEAGRGGFSRILVPTDFSDTSMEAIATATEMAAENADIEILHCWQLPPQGASHRATASVLEPVLKAVTAAVAQKGDELVAKLASDKRTVRFHAVREAPAQGIQERLESEDFDLVVMGSHGRRGIRRFFIGSVAEATLRHSRCSVMIVRPKAR